VKEQQIAEVIREEKSRGRRGPASVAARNRHAELKRLYRKLLERGTEEEFCKAMRALGLPAESEQFREALRIWRENRLL